MITKLLGVGLIAASSTLVAAQTSYPPAFPRTNATKLLETDRIVVWNIVWPKAQPTAMHRHVHDQVGTYYARGGRLITMPDGTSRQAMTEVGSLSTTRKGTTHIEEGTTDPPLKAVFIELKQDTASGGVPDATDPANRFPRDGAKQLLDDDRVVVWDLTWAPETFKYHPGRDALIVWLDGGKARLTDWKSAFEIVDIHAGGIQYIARGSNQTAEVILGNPRAIIFEFK